MRPCGILNRARMGSPEVSEHILERTGTLSGLADRDLILHGLWDTLFECCILAWC